MLMNDSTFPWFILVPERTGIGEIYQLDEDDQSQFIRESCHLAEQLYAAFSADKINIAALGNLVSQLHVHHVVRYRGDPAWPAPIWGRFAAKPYTLEEFAERKARLAAVLKDGFDFF